MANVVWVCVWGGGIDATSHDIYIPENKPERLFYSGHRHYHCLYIHRSLWTTIELFVTSNLCSWGTSMMIFSHLPLNIGFGLELDFQETVGCLVTRFIHRCRYPVLTAFKSNQIQGWPEGERSGMKRFNFLVRQHRAYVE